MTTKDMLLEEYEEKTRQMKERNEAIDERLKEIAIDHKPEVLNAQIRVLQRKYDEAIALGHKPDKILSEISQVKQERDEFQGAQDTEREALKSESEQITRELKTIATGIMLKHFKSCREQWFKELSVAMDLLENIESDFKSFASMTRGHLPNNFIDSLLPHDHVLYGPENKMLFIRMREYRLV